MPEYPGGNEAMMRYVATNVQYPTIAKENDVQGTVFVSFIVDKTGKVVDAKVVRGIGYGCDKESLRVVNSMPKWTPGTQRGKTVRTRFTLPIKFMLE